MSNEIETPLSGTEEVSAEATSKQPRTPEQKEYNRVKTAESRARKMAKQDSRVKYVNSTIKITKADAKDILRERGIKNDHVIDMSVELAQVAAQASALPFNDYLLRHGLSATKQRLADKKFEPQEVSDEPVAGELLNRVELFALYDLGFWRQPDISFDQWLVDRLKFKMSAFELSTILGKEDFGKKHEEWTDFAPRWNPVGLKPNYTQREALTWLDAQSDTKKYLLVASRNSMKSTWARILALTLTITCPDAPILIVSETNKLSKKAMKEFRGYLEMNPNYPTLFQQYFAEYTVASDSGQAYTYENPLAHLGLPQIACESSSMESANTGSRFWLCIFDDPISRDNGTSNEEQRAAAISKHGSIMKLREPAGYALNIQTPWVQDDLGDVMIKRNEEDPEKPLAVRIDPVMEIRQEAKNKGLLELKEEDVILNFLPKLNWKFVRDEMRSPEGLSFFKTQYMTEWLVERDEIKCQFDPDELRSRTRAFGFFGNPIGAQTVMSLDRAFSVSRYADYSCCIVGKVQPVEGKQALVIADVRMDRWRESDLVKSVTDMIEKHQPTIFTAEQDRGWETLAQSIRENCLRRGIPVPYFRWKTITPTDRAKPKE